VPASPIEARDPLCGLYGDRPKTASHLYGLWQYLAHVWMCGAIAMRSNVGPGFHQDAPESDNPGLDLAYEIAEVAMEVEGPLFWAILLVALVVGPLGIHPFG
jgi:hypothetical protein